MKYNKPAIKNENTLSAKHVQEIFACIKNE